jgi:hypothetical protein
MNLLIKNGLDFLDRDQNGKPLRSARAALHFAVVQDWACPASAAPDTSQPPFRLIMELR